MSCAAAFTPAAVLATRRAGLTSAPLRILTLALTIGSLPLPLRNQCTG